MTYPRAPVDRDQIERRDFPSVRRGYDAAAVHAHLRLVADEFEALRRSATPSLAEDAAARVRSILEAAEASAQQLRDEAEHEAGTHVERVQRSADDLLAKLDRLQAEVDGLRATAAALAGSLEELGRDAATLAGAGVREEPPDAASNGARSEDEAGARLVALNMALEGASREDAERYLGAHYELADVEALLDDVYASAGR